MMENKILKDYLYRTLSTTISIQEFEIWLYKQDYLADCMDDELILALFTFDYRVKDAFFEFRQMILSLVNEMEFLLWDVKTMLISIITGIDVNERDRILQKFIDLSRLGYLKLE